MRSFLGLAPLLTVFAAPATAGEAVGQLSDADLVAYAAKPFDRGAMMFQRVTVGRHHGALVVADFPCGDICPNYTVRIIHYDVPPGLPCARIGGVTQSRAIPQGIAVGEHRFCVPAVLANAK